MANENLYIATEPEVIEKEKKVPISDTVPGFMKAVRIHQYGGSENLIYEDAPIPHPSPVEVLIKVHAAGVNPVDWKIREGYMSDAIPHKLPLTLGWDVAGTITGKGALVTRFKEGDRVFARPDISFNGCYAEYVTVKACDVAFAPGISMDMAAGVPLAAQTAWMGLFEVGGLKPTQKVLIHGASGGVGTFAVQLAKIAGAYVIGTTSGLNVDMVKTLGADEVIDYKQEDFSEMLKEIDMVFDTIGGETQQHSWKVLRKGGTLVSTVEVNNDEAVKHEVIGKSFMMVSNGARLQEIAGLIDNDLLQVIIDKEFPLEEAKMAHELSQTGKACGKIILRVYDNSEY